MGQWGKQASAVKDETMPVGGDAKELVRADCIKCGKEFLTYEYVRPDLDEKNRREVCHSCSKESSNG